MKVTSHPWRQEGVIDPGTELTPWICWFENLQDMLYPTLLINITTVLLTGLEIQLQLITMSTSWHTKTLSSVVRVRKELSHHQTSHRDSEGKHMNQQLWTLSMLWTDRKHSLEWRQFLKAWWKEIWKHTSFRSKEVCPLQYRRVGRFFILNFVCRTNLLGSYW